MKVLLCGTLTSNWTGGTATTISEFMPVLEAKGVDVLLYASVAGWNKEMFSKHSLKKIKIFHSIFNNQVGLSFGLFRELWRTIGDFDIIQLDCFYNVQSIVAAWCARLKGVPYIVCPRGNTVPESFWGRKIRNSLLKRLFYELFSKDLMNKADFVVCASEKEKKDLNPKFPGAKFTVINNGINITKYSKEDVFSSVLKEFGIAGHEPGCLFIGRIALEKNLEFLIDVWEVIVDVVPNALLILAGPDYKGYGKKVSNYVSQSRCSKNVIMTGKIDGDLKLALLKWSRVFLLPSKNESFGNVVLESLVAGTPVITSTGTPWSSLEDAGVGRWLPLDKAIWGDAVAGFLNDARLDHDVFVEKSRKWVRDKFSWEKTVDGFIRLYEDIMRTQGARS